MALQQCPKYNTHAQQKAPESVEVYLIIAGSALGKFTENSRKIR